jgi:hypothetical protein
MCSRTHKYHSLNQLHSAIFLLPSQFDVEPSNLVQQVLFVLL